MCKREGEKEKILFLGLDNLIYIAGVSYSLFHVVCHVSGKPSTTGVKNSNWPIFPSEGYAGKEKLRWIFLVKCLCGRYNQKKLKR
jgi:hypothetical protein